MYIKKKLKTEIGTGIFTVAFIEALFTIAKQWKQLKYSSTYTWINKMWYTHTYGISFSLKGMRFDTCCNMGKP